MVSFLNDYNCLGHKDVMNALMELSNENNIGYGLDKHSINARKIIQKIINNNADIYFLAGGTITNRIGLYQMLKPYEAIICANSGHINVHETGAVESTGHKILTIDSVDGKLHSEDVLELLKEYNDSHKVMPRALYISDSTEIGTIYTLEELKKLHKVCADNDLYLFLDGARLGVALVAEDNDLTLEDIAKYCDMFYIGGTKNGAPLGEALVITNDTLKKNFNYLLKNQGGLLAKGFLSGIIFETLFTNDLYFKNAKNSVYYASLLRKVFKDNNIIEQYPNTTNQIFVKIDFKLYEYLKKDFLFEIWENKKEYLIVRFVTNFNTSLEDIKKIEKKLKSF